jgi:hypothetical protein
MEDDANVAVFVVHAHGLKWRSGPEGGATLGRDLAVDTLQKQRGAISGSRSDCAGRQGSTPPSSVEPGPPAPAAC